MKFVKQCGILVLFLTTTFLFACSGGGGSSGVETGTVSIALTDSSCGSYAAIYVTIDEVQVNKKDSINGNSGWETVAAPMKTYNLLKLVNGVTETLGEKELEAGTYHQIRLIIGKTAESENNINGLPHPYANYVLFDDGSDEPLKIPSGYNTGIKLVHNFEVEEGRFVELLLDFEACKSVVETGSGKYILKPIIKVINPEDKSDVYGQIIDADSGDPVGGAMVSAQISDGFSATVVRSTLTDENGQYLLLLSPRQTYNIVVYPEPPNDLKGVDQIYSPACAEITVPLDKVLEQNFTLEKKDFGTISGDVFVNGELNSEYPTVVYIGFYQMLDCGYIEVTSLSVSPDPDYTYTVDLPVGEYDVVASSEGFDPDTKKAELTNSGDSVEIDLNL